MTQIVAPDLLPLLLRYEPDAGKLFWLERSTEVVALGGCKSPERYAKVFNSQFSGVEAFTAIGQNGYHTGAIFNRLYYAHRVIWAMTRGFWPLDQIDHINGNRADNRLQNLRAVNQSQNNQNAKPRRGSSRFKGVSWHPELKRWHVQISKNGTRLASQFHHTEIEAAAAYDALAKEAFGEFAATNESIGLLKGVQK